MLRAAPWEVGCEEPAAYGEARDVTGEAAILLAAQE